MRQTLSTPTCKAQPAHKGMDTYSHSTSRGALQVRRFQLNQAHSVPLMVSLGLSILVASAEVGDVAGCGKTA